MTDDSSRVIAWWVTLGAVSIANLCIWALMAARAQREPDPELRRIRRQQLFLSAMFVIGCAFRSFFPRVEGERFCLYDSWISNAVISRAIATVAEMSLVAQWTFALARWAREDNARPVLWIARALLPLIAVAELCSWYTTLTTNFLGGVIEESFWAGTASLMTLAMVWLWPRSDGGRRRTLGAAIVLNAAYVVFMCTVDVPMYALRWRRDQTRGAQYLSLTEGARDAWQRRIVTRRWEHWREEIPWMTLYFSAGVWISLSLIRAPYRPLATLVPAREPAMPAAGAALS